VVCVALRNLNTSNETMITDNTIKRISSTKELDTFLKRKGHSSHKDFILCKLDEYSLLNHLNDKKLNHERIGFKTWRIFYNKPTIGKFLLRLFVLALLVIQLLYYLIKCIYKQWGIIENYFKDLSLLGNIVVELIPLLIALLFRKKIVKFVSYIYHLYMD
jgi:hypothetical protein